MRLDMNTLASRGPIGNTMATPSVCSYRAPLNWNSCLLVATLSRSTKSILVRFKSYVVLSQLFVKALFLGNSIISSKVMLVSWVDTYETKMSPLAITKLRISWANSNMSLTE